MKIKINLILLFIYTIVLCQVCFICRTNNSLTAKEVIGPESFNAKSVIAMDLETKEILYEQNINRICYPASITKLLTLYTALKYYHLDDFIIMKQEMVSEGSSLYLKLNECYKVEDLLYGMMLSSGNDASMALAVGLTGFYEDFISLMNYEAQKIGMSRSYFNNPNGLDETTKNVTTSYDMALLMSEAFKMPLFMQIISTKVYKHPENINRPVYVNHHRLLGTVPNFIGGKTGFTKLAGRTLVSCFSNETRSIVVVTLDAYDDWNIHKTLNNYFLGGNNE